MFDRKRSLKSNTRTLTVKDIGYDKVSKFYELMKRTGAESEEAAMVIIIDLLDEDLPKVEVDLKKNVIPQHVIEWRKANGYDDKIAHLVEELCTTISQNSADEHSVTSTSVFSMV